MMPKGLKFFLCAAAVVATTTACGPQGSYYKSVDIPTRWMPTDTLCVPLEVAATANIPGALLQGVPYTGTIGVRHISTFPYCILALTAELHYTDALGVEYLVRRTTLELPLADEAGAWTGGSWGSLIQVEHPLVQDFTFPYAGSYRLLFTPAYGDSVALIGLHSISLSLCRE